MRHSLERHCGDVAETKPTELLDWLDIVMTLETALRRALDATMFNWSCYMNRVYRETSPDPHIHWWLVPRDNHSVKIGAMTFGDPRFGSPYDHTIRLDVPKEMRQQIAEQLRHGIAMQRRPTD